MNSRYIPVENDPGYVVDPASSAILNTNTHALIEYKQKKKTDQTNSGYERRNKYVKSGN